MPCEWPVFLPFLLFFGFFFAAVSSAAFAVFAALLVIRFAAIAIFFISAAAFFFADWSFFRAASIAFAFFVACALFSVFKIVFYISGLIIEQSTIFFDLFFLFVTTVLMKFNSCVLIRFWAAL
jgi:hypothetical protein